MAQNGRFAKKVHYLKLHYYYLLFIMTYLYIFYYNHLEAIDPKLFNLDQHELSANRRVKAVDPDLLEAIDSTVYFDLTLNSSWVRWPTL